MTVAGGKRRRRAARPEADGSVLRWPGAAQRFALFGEVLWIGALMALVCLPVITWPAAVAAGAAHLRRYLAAEATPASEFFRDAARSLPGALGVGAGTTALAAVVGLDLVLLAGGGLPGGMPVAALVAAIGLAVLVLTVLAASLWSPGTPWRALLRISPRVARADLSGTAYTVAALGLAATIVWQFLPLVIPVLGLLAFALVAVGERRMLRLEAAAKAR